MSTTTQSIITRVHFPPARYVSGDIYEVNQKTDQQDQPRVYAAGHKRAGEPMMECFFGIAIPKAVNQTAAALAQMGLPPTFKQGWAIKPVFVENGQQIGWDQKYPGVPYWGEVIWLEAHKSFPHLINPASQRIELATFAWKMDDGDDTTPKGDSQIPNCKREGHAGCWIVYLKSGTAPKVYDESARPLVDKGAIKRGWWIEVSGSVQGNSQKQKPGVYINHDMLCYRAPDKEITFGPDPTSVFKGQFGLPVGVSAQPLGATNFPGAGLPGAPATGAPLSGGLPVAGVANQTVPGMPHVGVPAGLPGGLPNHQPALVASGVLPAGAPALGQGTALVGLPGALPARASLSNGLPAGAPAQPTAVQPHAGFLQPQVGLPAAQPAAQPAAPAQPILNPALVAQGMTWAGMVQQGWTVDTARQAGHVIG